METLSVYYYRCPHKFLKDAWQAKKKVNPSFSLRSWAKSLGFANNSPLSLMLQGSRPIPKKYLPAFSRSLELDPKESIFLETLVDLSREKDFEMKEYYIERLKSFAPKGQEISFNEVDSYKYLSNPIHSFLLEMSELSGFKIDPSWIQSRLSVKASIEEIKEALSTLRELGLMSDEGEKTHSHIHNQPDVKNLGAQKYHEAVSKLASQAVSKQDVSERMFSSYTMNIKKDQMEKAKDLMREFSRRFMEEVEAPSAQGEETYQLNMQFFKITQ